jgi:S1-C subfamily serine protease
VNRQYVATLAGIALIVLTAGLLLRSRLYSTPVETAPPSEASTLRQMSQEAQLRRSAAFVAEQVMAVAPSAEYVPATGASGVWWSRDTLLSTTRARPLVALARRDVMAGTEQRADSGGRPVTIAGDSIHRAWVVVVGRDAGGDVISAQFLAGGRTTTSCASERVQRYVLGAPLDARFAGAGVFSIDGAALGLAVWCNGEVVAVPTGEVRRLLGERPDTALESTLGFRVAEPGPHVRAVVGSDSAVLVTFVRARSAARESGLRAGDVLFAIDGAPATAETVRSKLGTSVSPESLVVARRSNGRTETVVLRDTAAVGEDDALGVELDDAESRRGLPIARVHAGSLAASAGLRAGDRLVSIGSTAVTSAATAQRLLASAVGEEAPTLVVVDREDGEHALLVGAQVAPSSVSDSTAADR